MMKPFFKLTLLALAMVAVQDAFACSRVVLRSDSTDIVMVGRTLDWRTPIPTNIYVYPAGMHRESMPDGMRLTWKSKYGSVIAVGYDGGVTEGMNERGLVMNGLFCKGSNYRTAAYGSNTPSISLAVFVSYFLDNFATVDEAEAWLRKTEFGISGQTFDGGTVSLLHWALTDTSGKTLIIEFNNGEMDLYSSKNYQVLTNDPQYQSMQAIEYYWQSVGGENFLPGGVRSRERFARGSYFMKHIPTSGICSDQALWQLTSIMNNVSVPLGYEVKDRPNLSSTQWRSIADINRQRYYMHFTNTLSTFYIDLSTINLSHCAPVLKLDTSKNENLFGNVNAALIPSQPFKPMW